MRNKIFPMILATAILGSFAFGANNAVEFSNKVFAAKKEASAKEAAVRDICIKIHKEMLDITKNMTLDEREDFSKEFRMQMRKNMATLGKDEYFNPRICAKFVKKPMGERGVLAPKEPRGGLMGNCIQDDCPYFK